jgi:hypothetical protein
VIPGPPRKLGFDALWLAMQERPRSLFVGLFFTVLPLMQLSVFLLVFDPLFQEEDDAKICATGEVAQGEVVRVEDVPNLSVNGRHPMRVYFRYKVGGAEREASMLTLSTTEVAKWQKGRPVAVRYLGDRATLADLTPADFPIPRAGLVALTLLLNGCFGMPFFVYALIGLRRKYRLLANGIVCQGKLLSFETLSSFFSWYPTGRFMATYTYLDSAGREVLGSAPSRDLTLLNGKTKGDPIDILVLPTNERRSTILDSSAERALNRATSVREA